MLHTRERRFAISVVLITVIALVLAACGGTKEAPITVPEGAQAGDLVALEPCTYEANRIEYEAECGTLVVPENRSDPASRLIALPMIRVHALSASPTEPIFFLQGGPGQSNLEFEHLDGMVEGHDVVQVGYRGIDGSVVLHCPEISEAIRGARSDMLSDAALDGYAEAGRRCTERLRAEGVDLAGYTITETIDDMEAARVALGYDKINLLGESYGTRVEMIYEWMYPDSLHRVAMVAVNPPGHLLWEADVIDMQIGDYAELCAMDADCSARTADLTASMRRVSETMPDRWLIFPIDQGGVKMISFTMLSETVQPSGVPVPLSAPAAIDMWLAAEKGDYSGMALMSAMRNIFLPTMLEWGEVLTLGGSVKDYRDSTRDYRAELNPSDSVLGSPASLFYAALIPVWPDHQIADEYQQVQSTDVRTLLVSGNLDFATPAQFATEELLPYLADGEQVILEDFGHMASFWTNQPEARRHLLATFFDTGEVDASLYTYQPVDFDAGLGWPGLAKVVLGIVLAVIVLLAVLVWFVVRRVGRRRAS